MPPVHLLPPGAAASRFGDITPAFAAACGASVSIGLLPPARNAEARAVAAAARRPRMGSVSPPLPVEPATSQRLPPSRISAGLVTALRR